MRCILASLAVGFLISASIGCSSDDGEPVSDAGQATSTAATSSAAGMAPMGDPSAAGDSAMSSGAMPGEGAAPGMADPAAGVSGPPMGMPGPGMSGPPMGMPGPSGTPGMTGTTGTTGSGPPPGMAMPSYAGPADSSAGIAGAAIPGAGPADSSAAIPGDASTDPAMMAGGTPGYPADAAAGVADSSGAVAGAAIPGAMIPGAAIPGAGVPGGAYPGVPGAGMPGSPGAAAAVPTTFDGLAARAFQQGREREGLQYLQAWALTSDAGAAEVLSGFQWVPGLRRPAMAVRWGVGVALTAPRNFAGDAKPIGTQQQFATARRPGGGGADGSALTPGGFGAPGSEGMAMPGGSGFGGAGGGAVTNENVAKFAGDFGTKFLEQFQSRVASGKFGKALRNAASGSAGAASPGGYAGAEASAGVDSTLEPGGFSGAAAGAAMPGGYGAAMAGGAMPGMAGGAGAGGAAGSARITTGLTFLGMASDKELKEKAVQEKVDVLAIFRVKITVNRAGLVNNDTELVLFDPVKNREIYNSPTLNNIKIQKDREQNKDDSVDKEVGKIFAVVDKELAMTELPAALTPEVVKTSRVEGQLLAGPIEEPLAVLTEIRFYHRGKLLSDDDSRAAMAKVAGDAAAATLLEGKEEDRKKVVEKWLPQT